MSAARASGVPPIRIRDLNDADLRTDGKFVLYWMVANRRPVWNFALDHAIEMARELDCPLIVLEALRAGYPWASDRMHRFVIDGMVDNQFAFDPGPILYYPYVEPEPGAGRGLVERLAAEACLVVTDDYPAFFIPRMLGAVAQRLSVRMRAVDSNGILPLRATQDVFARAYDFRRFLQRELRPYLGQSPRPNPLRVVEKLEVGTRIGIGRAKRVSLPESVHKRGEKRPEPDDCVDWILLSGQERTGPRVVTSVRHRHAYPAHVPHPRTVLFLRYRFMPPSLGN